MHAVRPNNMATGLPNSSGTAQVAQELTAGIEQIADEDGMGHFY